jgi:hypothetical protein
MPGRAFWRGAIPGLVVAACVIAGAGVLRYGAHLQLLAAQAQATPPPATANTVDPDTLATRVNDAEAMLKQAIATRNVAVGSVVRLDRLAAALPSGARLTDYHQSGSVGVEGLGQSELGQTAQAWAGLGFHISVATTGLGAPGTHGSPAIEPNIQLVVADAIQATPAPIATQTPGVIQLKLLQTPAPVTSPAQKGQQ